MRDRVGRGAQRDGHVTQLRQGRVSDHALDVVLDDAQEAHEQCSDSADHQDEGQARSSDSSKSGDIRETMKIPAVTMVAA